MSFLQAWEDLMAPKTVHYEDILNVTAQPAPTYGPPPVPDPKPEEPGKTFLSSWKPADSNSTHQKSTKTIHHFCTVTDDVQLPDHYLGVWRRYHVPSKLDVLQSKKNEVCHVHDAQLLIIIIN